MPVKLYGLGWEEVSLMSDKISLNADRDSIKTAGIITYWDTKNNYGTVLQNYALQQFLKKLNVRAFLMRIQFDSKLSRIQIYKHMAENYGLKKLVAHIFSRPFIKALNASLRIKQKDLSRNFANFIETNLNPSSIFHSYAELERCCPEADFYIAGSDQIWNTYGKPVEEIGDEIRAYLLSFVQGGKMQVSCAASFGSPEFDPTFSDIFKNALEMFEFVSVREQSGVDICRKLGIQNVFLQQDPTMLMSVSDYRNIESKSLVPKKPYILLYLLGNTTDFSIRTLKSFAAQNGLDMVYVSANEMQRINFYKKVYPTISEWLGLFDCAEYVVTNSFHGTVFSLIFNKNFLFVPQCGKFQNQNGRIGSLLDCFGLADRIFTGRGFENLMNPVGWGLINAMLAEIRERSPFALYAKSITQGGSE